MGWALAKHVEMSSLLQVEEKSCNPFYESQSPIVLLRRTPHLDWLPCSCCLGCTTCTFFNMNHNQWRWISHSCHQVLLFSRSGHEHELYSQKPSSERYQAFFHFMLFMVSITIHLLSEIDWIDKLHTPQHLPKILLVVSCFWAWFEPYQGLFYFFFLPHHFVGRILE